jgi:succinate dehydrogenase / fumarate reductase membrane anchor subunit
MVKSVLSVNHQGLRDWVIQRVSAVIMAIYSFGMMLFFLTHSNMDFVDWRMLFNHTWMKVATILFVISLLFHAWVGMWTIFTDYVKFAWLRFILHVLVFFALVACFFWALQIVWGI